MKNKPVKSKLNLIRLLLVVVFTIALIICVIKFYKSNDLWLIKLTLCAIYFLAILGNLSHLLCDSNFDLDKNDTNLSLTPALSLIALYIIAQFAILTSWVTIEDFLNNKISFNQLIQPSNVTSAKNYIDKYSCNQQIDWNSFYGNNLYDEHGDKVNDTLDILGIREYFAAKTTSNCNRSLQIFSKYTKDVFTNNRTLYLLAESITQQQKDSVCDSNTKSSIQPYCVAISMTLTQNNLTLLSPNDVINAYRNIITEQNQIAEQERINAEKLEADKATALKAELEKQQEFKTSQANEAQAKLILNTVNKSLSN